MEGGSFSKGIYNNLLQYEGKRLGIEFRTEGEYASQIRSLSDNISPRREPFQAPFLRAEADNFGSWVFATTSSAFDEDRTMVHVVRVNPQLRILTADEDMQVYFGAEEAINSQDLTADRKFTYFDTQPETPGANIAKYHMVESLVRRLQQKLIAQESSEMGEELYEDYKGNLPEAIKVISKVCRKYPDAMRGYTHFLGHKDDKKKILDALENAGMVSRARVKILKHFPIADVGFEGGFRIKQSKELKNFSLCFSPANT